MTSKEAIEIAIKEVYKVLNGIDKRLNEGSLEFGDDYKYYNSPEELKKALDKQSKYISTIEKLTYIKKDLERLEKLEKFIRFINTKRCCLDEISPSSWNNKKVYKEMCNYDYYLFALEANYYSLKDKERILTQEEFNLLKEVLENE